MKSMFLRSGALVAASLLATSALAAQQAPAEEPETAAPADQTAEKSETAEAPAEAEPERICRYIKLDTASRRKTKICRTTDEWRDLGNPR